jgi:4-amino-4-deoxy-L-arabinose transferase-like glycosyltransferase
MDVRIAALGRHMPPAFSRRLLAISLWRMDQSKRQGAGAAELAAPILVGAAVRIYLAWTASVIARDAVQYVTMARRMATDWRAELDHDYPLGYPFMIRIAHAVCGSHLSSDLVIAWQRAGQLVCVVFGVACIPLVYWLGRRLLGARSGLIAAWIWALLPQAAALSADALTDMPHLALVLAALALAVVGLGTVQPDATPTRPFAESDSSPAAPRRPPREFQLPALFGAGLMSGVAYTLRPEGAEVAIVAALLALLRRRTSVSRKAPAVASVLIGFAIIGGAYIVLEGGRVFNKQSWLLETQANAGRAAYSCSASLAESTGPTAWARAAAALVEKLTISLNGVWLVLGAAFGLLPDRRRMCRDLRAPSALWTLHTLLLLFLYTQRGYISSRHVMLLDVAFVIFAAGTLTWLSDAASKRFAPQWQPVMRRMDALALAAISLGLAPWLLRDINFNRFYVRDAGRWISERYVGQGLPGIVAPDGWAPFYAGAIHWGICRSAAGLSATAELDGAQLLVMQPDQTPPLSVRVRATGRDVEISKLASFVEPDHQRGFVVYALRQRPP